MRGLRVRVAAVVGVGLGRHAAVGARAGARVIHVRVQRLGGGGPGCESVRGGAGGVDSPSAWLGSGGAARSPLRSSCQRHHRSEPLPPRLTLQPEHHCSPKGSDLDWGCCAARDERRGRFAGRGSWRQLPSRALHTGAAPRAGRALSVDARAPARSPRAHCPSHSMPYGGFVAVTLRARRHPPATSGAPSAAASCTRGRGWTPP